MSRKLQSHLRTKSGNKISCHAVSTMRFPATPPLLAVYIHKTTTGEISKYITMKNSCNNFFLFFLVVQQRQISILFYAVCYLCNLLLTQCICGQRNCYRRQAPYYWTLPCPVELWFEIHYTDRTIPGVIPRLSRMKRESFDLLRNLVCHLANKKEYNTAKLSPS